MSEVGYKPSKEEFANEYPLDFGMGVRGAWYTFKTIEHAGLIIAHLHPDGTLCAGSVGIDGRDFEGYNKNRPLWTIEQEDPLTLSPSILDNSCGLHGWIREGKWVSA